MREGKPEVKGELYAKLSSINEFLNEQRLFDSSSTSRFKEEYNLCGKYSDRRNPIYLQFSTNEGAERMLADLNYQGKAPKIYESHQTRRIENNKVDVPVWELAITYEHLENLKNLIQEKQEQYSRPSPGRRM